MPHSKKLLSRQYLKLRQTLIFPHDFPDEQSIFLNYNLVVIYHTSNFLITIVLQMQQIRRSFVAKI
jgi:hypothetical protein